MYFTSTRLGRRDGGAPREADPPRRPRTGTPARSPAGASGRSAVRAGHLDVDVAPGPPRTPPQLPLQAQSPRLQIRQKRGRNRPPGASRPPRPPGRRTAPRSRRCGRTSRHARAVASCAFPQPPSSPPVSSSGRAACADRRPSRCRRSFAGQQSSRSFSVPRFSAANCAAVARTGRLHQPLQHVERRRLQPVAEQEPLSARKPVHRRNQPQHEPVQRRPHRTRPRRPVQAPLQASRGAAAGGLRPPDPPQEVRR